MNIFALASASAIRHPDLPLPVDRHLPVTIATPEPAPQPPSPVSLAKPAATDTATPVAVTAPPAPAPAALAAPATPPVQLPSSSADYLNNPRPPYLPLSKRLGEQGRVLIRARIEVNGSASQAEMRTASGYERLDQAALQTVKRWRFLPGKRAGVPEEMWFNIPIQFVFGQRRSRAMLSFSLSPSLFRTRSFCSWIPNSSHRALPTSGPSAMP